MDATYYVIFKREEDDEVVAAAFSAGASPVCVLKSSGKRGGSIQLFSVYPKMSTKLHYYTIWLITMAGFTYGLV